jgi:hypothetical protein
MADMEVDVDVPTVASKKDDSKKRFEVKKVCTILYKLRLFTSIQWNAVALWAWGKPLHHFLPIYSLIKVGFYRYRR